MDNLKFQLISSGIFIIRLLGILLDTYMGLVMKQVQYQETVEILFLNSLSKDKYKIYQSLHQNLPGAYTEIAFYVD